MKDPRIQKLAHILVNYSCEVTKDDIVLIDFSGEKALPLVGEIYKACLLKKAKHVEYHFHSPDIERHFFTYANQKQLTYFPKHQLDFMKQVTVYIGIGSSDNIMTFATVNSQKLVSISKILKPILDERVNNTRWVVTRFPSYGTAQDAKMSLEEFEDFYFKACNIDWKKEELKQKLLKQLMDKTNSVRLKAPQTDLSLSIRGMKAITCCGKRNMPDGEVFTAPVKNSVQGYITFDAPTMYNGKEFKDIRLEFKDGKIIKATAPHNENILNQILDTDKGARYTGEFALGLNKHITKPMRNPLFDEKIKGSIHLTPGASYEECFNGNKSAIHWDLVRILKPDGELYFDNVLVQKNGEFVHPKLKPLNY